MIRICDKCNKKEHVRKHSKQSNLCTHCQTLKNLHKYNQKRKIKLIESQGGTNEMAGFKDFELPKTRNIAELEAVSIKVDIKTETRGEGENAFTYNFIVVDNEEYRVPNSVIKMVQALILEQEIKTFKVLKTGSGMDTKYSIQVLE